MNEKKERLTVYFDKHTLDLLKLYCFECDVRTVNTAAVQIVSDYVREWKRSID